MDQPGSNKSVMRRLLLIGNQALALANELAEASRVSGSAGAGGCEGLMDDSPLWLLAAEEQYKDRRRRGEFFPAQLFGEPCWDMLLDLYCSEKRNQRVSVTAACIGASVPATTGLRTLTRLEEEGFVEREGDRTDSRRSYVRLTDIAYSKMTAFFAEGRKHWLSDDFVTRSERSSRASSSTDNGAYLIRADSS